MFYNTKSQNPTGNLCCPVSNPMPYTIKTKCPKGHLIFMADGEGLPRHKCLRRIRDDFAALCLQNLLIVEPNRQLMLPSVQPEANHDKNKMPQRAFNFYGGW